MRLEVTHWALLASSLLLTSTRGTTILFDGEGPEEGITGLGVEPFSFMGSNWDPGAGAAIVEAADPAWNASGEFAYQIFSSDVGAFVTFDEPVHSIDFFYVHSDLGAGHAIVYDTEFNLLGSFESHPPTFFGDPVNFISFSSPMPIGSINLISGIVDNFTFTTLQGGLPVPTASEWGVISMSLVLLACGTVSLSRRIPRSEHDASGMPRTDTRVPPISAPGSPSLHPLRITDCTRWCNGVYS